MQVFIVGSPLETAQALDRLRLNKQIVECTQILDAISGTKKAWSNHPCTIQYRNYVDWLRDYMSCLMWFREGKLSLAEFCNECCNTKRPLFHTQDYFDQMKRRLFTKNQEHYKQWAYLGTSDINWYWSESENNFIKYNKGKRVYD